MFGFKKKPKMPEFVLMNCVKDCGKEKCPQWVILHHKIKDEKGEIKDVPEGRCAMAWIPVMLTEVNNSLQAILGQLQIGGLPLNSRIKQ